MKKLKEIMETLTDFFGMLVLLLMILNITIVVIKLFG